MRNRRRNHEEEITLGDGSIVFERITPTQAFSDQQDGVLNGWSGGGGKMKGGVKRKTQSCLCVEFGVPGSRDSGSL